MTWSRLHGTEKAAIIIFGALFASTCVEAWLYRQFWILGFFGLLILWATALIIAAVKISDAVRDPDLFGPSRTRAIAAIPIAIGLVLILKFGLALGQRVEASTYLLAHRAEMTQAERLAAPGQAAEIKFVEGVPDGGLAIVRWHKEPVRSCLRIWPDAWLCHYN